MKIILWIISPIIFIIGITGFVGIISTPLKILNWDYNWFDKMIIINMIIIIIMLSLFSIIGGTFFIHEIMCKLIELI